MEYQINTNLISSPIFSHLYAKYQVYKQDVEEYIYFDDV